MGAILQRGTVNELIQEVVDAYDAPFPSEEYKCGVRKFPMLVPSTPDNVESENNRQAWQALSRFNKPFLTAFSDSDPITAGAEKFFQKNIPGCSHQQHVIFKGGGHFLQEDVGEQLIRSAISFFKGANLDG